MKNKIQLLMICMTLIIAAFHLESCSSYKGIASKPDGHNRFHPDFAMHNIFKKHNSNYYKKSNTDLTSTANHTAAPAPASVAPIESKTATDISSMSASSSNEVPKIKNAKEMYQLLTAEERNQAKQEVDKIFAKRPIMKSMVDSKLNKLNEKYPAPATSTLHKDGGSLSLGEILAIVAIACAVTWILGIAGLIIGIIALQKIKNEGGATWAKILAIVAIVLGAIDLLTFIIWLALLITATSRI